MHKVWFTENLSPLGEAIAGDVHVFPHMPADSFLPELCLEIEAWGLLAQSPLNHQIKPVEELRKYPWRSWLQSATNGNTDK